MEKLLTIVISSKKTIKESQDLLKNIETTIDVPCNIMFIQNDGVGLTTVYYEAMLNII